MNMEKYEWLEKKTPRSVEQLRLWPDNPRLNPSEKHLHLSDYVEDLIDDEAEKKHFFKLVISIAEDGFVPADPVVVWKNEDNDKYYVAEGNRRLLALKLLRQPDKAPKSIRSFIRSQSKKINSADIEKILVNVAPTFDEAEWYINQRNSASSLQRSWSRPQQQRWISDLYHKYNGDITVIMAKTRMTKGELEGYIRNTKFIDILKETNQKGLLTDTEYEVGSHYRFPITILERFFGSAIVSKAWGFKFDGMDIVITSNRDSFLKAYAELIKGILDSNRKPIAINTRSITADLQKVLNSLPEVGFDIEKPRSGTDRDIFPEQPAKEETPHEQSSGNSPAGESGKTQKPSLKNNPNRPRLVLPIYNLITDSSRLTKLFNELKEIPLKYNNSVAASIRIFLDLAVLNYLRAENLEITLKTEQKCGMEKITLSCRLEFLKQQKKFNPENIKIVSKLLKSENEYSLDVLNGYVHSDKTHYLSKTFLNGFWDFLFPLFQQLLEIRESKKNV
jgi:hypothetical protein